MSPQEANRRDFLKMAGLSAVGLGLPLNHGVESDVRSNASSGERSPFSSLKDVFEAPRSGYFGVKVEERQERFGNGQSGRRLKLVPRDPKTLYTADGLSGEEEPHSFQLTFEISNNSILCSANQGGLLKHPCIFSRKVPASRRGRDLVSEELVGGSVWGFGLIRDGGMPVRLPMTHGAQVELLGSVFPLFSYRIDDLWIQLLAFAPRFSDDAQPAPRAMLAVVKIENHGKTPWQGNLLAPDLPDISEGSAISTPVESPHPRFTELPVPIAAGYEAMSLMDETRWSPRCPLVHHAIAPGAQAISSFAILLDTSPENLQRTMQVVRRHTTLDWFNQSWQVREKRYGRLSIPADPYYSENYIRLIEGGNSAVLHSADGQLFNGGPSGFIDYGMMLFEPKYMAESLQSLAGYRRHTLSPAEIESLGYSLVSALGHLPSAGLYYRATDNRELFLRCPGIMEFARERLADLLKLRKGAPYLFPSKMLWDGPTLGDYHTGSNIMAWLAFSGMGRIAREVYGEAQLGKEWLEIAGKIKDDIYRHCVGDCALGKRFFEGGNADGTFAQGHDGEEAFTTLAPFFGFCEADDPALINHARLAFTPDNPLYEPAVDGIWWASRGDRWGGITTPGQLAMLVANNDESELAKRLDQLRSLTDLDGSIWWWPYLYPCNDRTNVRRRDWPVDTSKSGFTMAVASCLLVNNVFGLCVDVPDRRVSFRPFCPWDDFSWSGAKLGNSLFDLAYKRDERHILGRITNRNKSPFTAIIEVMLRKGQSAQKVLTSGKPISETQNAMRFGRPSVRICAPVPPDTSLELLAEFA
ncbi:MAG TPA: hypothetical protein VE398_08820 [Acidobacteriota bacterium]|nr:hypothetical protein [Acidobacteriota bacterium]